MATGKEIAYAKKIVQVIKDAQKNDGVKTISITCPKKHLVINIEDDFGNLENVKFGSSYPHIIYFETGFILSAKNVKEIKVVSIGKTLISNKDN